MVVRGTGADYDVLTVSVHEDYSAYQQAAKEGRSFSSVKVEVTQSYIAELRSKSRYESLGSASFVSYLSRQREK